MTAHKIVYARVTEEGINEIIALPRKTWANFAELARDLNWPVERLDINADEYERLRREVKRRAK